MASSTARAGTTATADRADARLAPPNSLPNSPAWALFLDLDGTLAPLRDDPAEVALRPAQRATLRRIAQRLDGAVCVLSGRSAEDLERILGRLPIARIGEHGHDVDGRVDAFVETELLHAERAMGALLDAQRGAWVERKRACCALHYRRTPELAESLTQAMRIVVSALPNLRLVEGLNVLEVTAAGSDKGGALRRVMRDARFAGRRPVAVGDDATDEDAFRAAVALGGFAVAVGARPSRAAIYCLQDAAAVYAWLAALAQSRGSSNASRARGCTP